MKIVLLYLIFVSTAFSQGTWQHLNSPTDKKLRSLSFVDSLNGWVAGDSGVVFHTSDSGNSWSPQQSGVDYDIEDIFFLNENLGWAVAWRWDSQPFGTIILRTTNGGLKWTNEAYRDENLFMNSIVFLDSLNGWMGGDPHALVKTTDSGLTWEQAEIDSANFAFFPVKKIRFYNNHYGFACGGHFDVAGVVWRTVNGGDKWFVTGGWAEPVFDLHFIDSLNIIAVGGDPEYGASKIVTTDGGDFWEYEELGIPGIASSVEFRTAGEGWVTLRLANQLMYTLDKGSTWEVIPTPDSSAIYELSFPDSLHGFGVGRSGAIIKYNPPVISDVEKISEAQPDDFILYQNYPNPFNPSTIIKFSVPASINSQGSNQKISLIVYDILGNEIATLVDGFLQPGTYEVEFSTNSSRNISLSSGIYLYKLQGVSKTYLKKMIYLK